MKTSIKFIIVLILIGASIFLLLDIGVRAGRWYAWLIFIFLPVAGYIVGKTDFRSPE